MSTFFAIKYLTVIPHLLLDLANYQCLSCPVKRPETERGEESNIHKTSDEDRYTRYCVFVSLLVYARVQLF